MNGFETVEQVERAPHPSQWVDADSLSAVELAFVAALRRCRERSRSRGAVRAPASFAVCVADFGSLAELERADAGPCAWP
jgi:hypothetical protein